jgi:hypothetical protein
VTTHGYEIGAKGRMPPALLAELCAEAPVPVPMETVLITGEIDQDELHYLIRRIADVGLELCELRQVARYDDSTVPVDEATMS